MLGWKGQAFPKKSSGRGPRVVFLNPGLYALGGMQAWLAELMPGLELEGFEVFLAVADGRFQATEGYLRAFPWPRSVRVLNRTGTRLGARFAVHELLETVQPDLLVVAHLVSALEAVAERRARGQPSPRLLVSFHALEDGFFVDVERFSAAIDGLVLPNRLLVGAARRRGVLPPERIFHGPYALEVPPFPEVVSWREGGPLQIVFAHRLEASQKRILDLPKVLVELERRAVAFELQIVGGGPDEGALRSAIEALPLPLPARVAWRGPLLPEVLYREVLTPERTLLITSSWENGPMVVLQAMARGVPVVSSRYLSSRAEGLLRDRETAWLFEVGDAQGAANALVLSTLEPNRSEVRRRAWEAVAERHERMRVAHLWAEIFRRVLNDPPPDLPCRLPEDPAPRGRLDRWFGVRVAEHLRRLFGLPGYVGGPGDEWPHTLGGALSQVELFRWLAQLEAELVSPSREG
jgi:glycosyltransferase involved in cell wall biosynthesis